MLRHTRQSLKETPAKEILDALTCAGLRPVLDAALLRFKRDGTLGRSRPNLMPQHWEALGRLTGHPPHGVLDLTLLDAALRGSRYGVGLPDILTALNGRPIIVTRQERETLALHWADLLNTVPDTEWRELLTRGEGGANLLRTAIKAGQDVTENLHLIAGALSLARTETPSFPVLAAHLTGNAHALDMDTLAGKVFRVALDALNLPHPARDGVSSVALCANLHGPAWLTGAAGHCLALPLREVQREDTFTVPGGQVWVVENPSVFEALHETHPHSPLICTSGQPGAAVTALLRRLPPETTAFLSCDLDVGGLRIASFLTRTVPLKWQLWHMDAQAYALALTRGSVPLSGPVDPFSPLFPELVRQMQQSGRGAHQENLLPELKTDVAATLNTTPVTTAHPG